jgi:hypothetical protein
VGQQGSTRIHRYRHSYCSTELEKRKGQWVVTRWYIEVGAPLAISSLPEGFSKEELQWIQDPRRGEAILFISIRRLCASAQNVIGSRKKMDQRVVTNSGNWKGRNQARDWLVDH